jgi:polar amino acid transport system ATP-binding protein/sulfate transport system ATP-binding protein
MAEGSVLLDVRDVHQELGGNPILTGVTFQVRDRVQPGKTTGQIVALLGPSGVGKTRLLRIIAGLDAPDSGAIIGPEGKPPVAGQVGVVFQNYPVLKHRRVLANLEVAGRANGLARAAAHQRAADLLGRFGLGDRASYWPAQLSGGQRQRVAIAQQIVVQKKLLLLDEPFSGLDPAALDATIKLLVEVAHLDELNTLVIVTHDIHSALLVSDTVYMLGRDRNAEGRVTSGAKIQAIYDLVAEGLAWRDDVELDPKFAKLERELRERFGKL